MQNLNPNPTNDFCERCGVVHTQEPVDINKVAAEALEVMVKAEDVEWKRMANNHVMAGETKPPAVLVEGELDRMRLKLAEMGISEDFLHDTQESFFAQHDGLSNPFGSVHPNKYFGELFGNQADVEALELLRGVTMVAEKPRGTSSIIVSGVSGGIYPYHGFTRGVFRSKHPQLSQIPKTPESRRLMLEQREANGEYIPKAGSDARIMFMVDSYPSDVMRDMGRIFEHEMYHAKTYKAQGQSTGKSTSMQHLMDYHHRAQQDIYAGDPGRPKASKAKRKAQKAARKGNRK